MIVSFLYKAPIKKGWCFKMINIIKEEIEIEDSLKLSSKKRSFHAFVMILNY